MRRMFRFASRKAKQVQRQQGEKAEKVVGGGGE